MSAKESQPEKSRKNGRPSVTEKEALDFHSEGRPGKLKSCRPSPCDPARSFAGLFPGRCSSVKAIAANPETAYDYTTRGNMVAVIPTARPFWASATSVHWLPSR